ncbi:MAG: hypothetical protein IPK82_38115 [Polyangiaceae bacterium]|nr:hypothetical protein [Polyangiaceae bacterium]
MRLPISLSSATALGLPVIVLIVGGGCGARSTLLEGETLSPTGGTGGVASGGNGAGGGQTATTSVTSSTSGSTSATGGGSPTTTSTGQPVATCPTFSFVKTLGGSGRQRVHQVELDSQGNSFVRGAYQTKLNLGSQIETPSESWSWFLAKLNSNLTPEWVHVVDGCDHFEAFGGPPPRFHVNGQGQPMAGVRVAVGQTCDFGTGPIESTVGHSDYLIMFDSVGAPLFQRDVPGWLGFLIPWETDGFRFSVTHWGNPITFDWFTPPSNSSAFAAQLDSWGNLTWASSLDSMLMGGGYVKPSRAFAEGDGMYLEGDYYGAVEIGDVEVPPTTCTYYSNQGNCQTWEPETFGAHAGIEGAISGVEVPARWLTPTPNGGLLAALPTVENDYSLDDIAYFAADKTLVYKTSFLPEDQWNGVGFGVIDRLMDLTGQVWVVAYADADIEVGGQKVEAGTFWVILDASGEISCVGDFGGSGWRPSLRLAPNGEVWFTGTIKGPVIINGEQFSPPDQFEELLFLKSGPTSI